MVTARFTAQAFDDVIAMTANADNIGARDIRQAMTLGMPEAKRLVSKFLTESLRRSGLKSISGELAKMVRRPVISILDPASSRVALKVSMPAGLKKEDYIKFNSLNYGAVRDSKDSLLGATGADGNKLIGAKQRVNLKNATRGGVSRGFKKTSRDIGISGGGKTKAGSTIFNTSAGRATVTKAHTFFYMTDAQIDKIKSVLYMSAMEYLTKKMLKKRGR